MFTNLAKYKNSSIFSNIMATSQISPRKNVHIKVNLFSAGLVKFTEVSLLWGCKLVSKLCSSLVDFGQKNTHIIINNSLYVMPILYIMSIIIPNNTYFYLLLAFYNFGVCLAPIERNTAFNY